MLTIGELAAFAGVSTRTVRYYHQLGLLPEPVRDESGYRRYQAAAVVQLLRVVALAAAGVPLARISELLQAEPAVFTAELARVDSELRAQIKGLRELRARLADLNSPERLALPASLVAVVEQFRRAGLPAEFIDVFRDSWVINYAAHPQDSERFLREVKVYDDPEYLDLLKRLLELEDAAADDPRLLDLAADANRWLSRWSIDELEAEYPAFGADSRTARLLESLVPRTPALERLAELMGSEMVQLGDKPNLPADA